MDTLDIKSWLNRAFYADKKIKALEMRLKQCRERAQSVSICYEGNDTAISKGSKNSTESTLVRLMEIEEKIIIEKNNLLSIDAEISEAIATLNDTDLETVLTYRYLLFKTIEQTAELMNYGKETVKRKQNKAIEKLSLNDLE